MWFQKRPSTQELFEYVSIPGEMSRWKRMRLALFLRFDPSARQQVAKLKETWESYFQPEPDIMDSVMRVYSKLRSDETLILKGWKLCGARAVARPPRETSVWTLLTASGVAAASGAMVLWLGVSPFSNSNTDMVAGIEPVHMRSEVQFKKAQPSPMARIRVQDRNSVQVQYIQPELLQSIEFETTSSE